MPYRVSVTKKTNEQGVFESILEERNIIVAAASVDPIDATTTGVTKYIIPAGTPMGPIPGTKVYKPIRRTRASSAVSNGTTITCDCTTPFAVGDGVRFYASLGATSTLRTIASITSSTVMVLTAAATVVDDDYFEVSENGAHAAQDAAISSSAPIIPDAVILKHDVEVLAADQATTYTVPAVGVYRGAIRRCNVNGPGVGASGATFDTILSTQLPNISFLPTSAGTA